MIDWWVSVDKGGVWHQPPSEIHLFSGHPTIFWRLSWVYPCAQIPYSLRLHRKHYCHKGLHLTTTSPSMRGHSLVVNTAERYGRPSTCFHASSLYSYMRKDFYWKCHFAASRMDLSHNSKKSIFSTSPTRRTDKSRINNFFPTRSFYYFGYH